MEFEWDEGKRAANLERHGIDFVDAAKFQFGTAVTFEDTRYDYGEVRWKSYGDLEGRPHVMIYTWRKKKVRIVSLRKANPREIKRYGKR